jgi:hypothetical protein
MFGSPIFTHLTNGWSEIAHNNKQNNGASDQDFSISEISPMVIVNPIVGEASKHSEESGTDNNALAAKGKRSHGTTCSKYAVHIVLTSRLSGRVQRHDARRHMPSVRIVYFMCAQHTVVYAC